MIVRIQAVVILVLMAALGYGVFMHKSKIEALQGQIHRLEVRAVKMESEYESRIASMKGAGGAGVPRPVPPAKTALAGFVSRLPVNPEKFREDTLIEMKQALDLDSSQVSETVRVLREFHQQRSTIVAEASKGKGLPFSPETMEAVDQARRNASEKLKTVLTEEQYRGMVEKGYDQRLGLRVAAQ